MRRAITSRTPVWPRRLMAVEKPRQITSSSLRDTGITADAVVRSLGWTWLMGWAALTQDDTLPFMDVTLVLSAGAAAASLAALASSTVIAVRQARTAYNANQVPVVADLIKELVSGESFRRELMLKSELPNLDPHWVSEVFPSPYAVMHSSFQQRIFSLPTCI